MSASGEFVDRLLILRGEVAKFHRVVLHSHSIHSHDYGRAFNGEEGSLVSSESEFAEAVTHSKLDMIGITDHMKCDYACRLSVIAARAGMCILPGMEVSLRPPAPWNTFRIHMLTIFPESCSLEQISRILPPRMPPEKDRSGHEEIVDIALTSFIETVHRGGGICIAAHVDSDRGIRKTFRQLGRDGIILCASGEELSLEEQRRMSEQFKEWLLLAGFDAIEVAKDSDRVHYRWVSNLGGTSVSVPVLLKSDAHRAEDLTVEQKCTHIKMTRPSFEDLKQALLFPDTRIRFPSDVPSCPSPRILGLEIVGGNDGGFFKNLQVAFSDNLTCLIGPRGSGKSAIIESLRYAFGLNRMLEQLEQSGTDLAKKVRSLQEATLSNCIIRVAYAKEDGKTHVLEAAFDPKQDHTTGVYTTEGNELEIHDLQARDAYPLRLFGWSEIETLGREAHRQRDLLDRLIPEFTALLERRNDLRQTLVRKRKEIDLSISKLFNILERNNGEIRRYKEYKADFERLNTPEIDSLFADIDVANEKLLVFDKIKSNIQDWLSSLGVTSDHGILVGVEELVAESSESLSLWWNENQVKSKVLKTQEEAEAEIAKVVTTLNALFLDLDLDIQKVTGELHEKEKEIREKIGTEVTKQVAAELRKAADQRLQRVSQFRREYNEEWVLFQGRLDQWKNTCSDIVELQKKVSEAREKQKDEIEVRLNRYSTSTMTISLRFRAGYDRNRFASHLSDGGVLTRQVDHNFRANLLPRRLSLLCTPVGMAESILAKDTSRLVGSTSMDGSNESVDENTAERLVSSLYPFGRDEEADVPYADGEKLGKVLGIAEVEWDDDEGILLNGSPVEKLSPGQRSSAMLPLIALAENAPLVIDQPEDNLDNRLVGRMLVEILANLKEVRQIIVATHNPNIVVSGDAEQVIVLDALSDHEGACKHAGSIDREQIVKSVIDIMEGGEEAFRNRSRRYGFH